MSRHEMHHRRRHIYLQLELSTTLSLSKHGSKFATLSSFKKRILPSCHRITDQLQEIENNQLDESAAYEQFLDQVGLEQPQFLVGYQTNFHHVGIGVTMRLEKCNIM